MGGGGSPLQSLSVTTGGPLAIKVDMTTQSAVVLEASKFAANPVGDSLTVGDPLNMAAVSHLLSLSGDISLLADNDITLLANSIVQANNGSVTVHGDVNDASLAGTQISVAGTINAPANGKSVSLFGNAQRHARRLRHDQLANRQPVWHRRTRHDQRPTDAGHDFDGIADADEHRRRQRAVDRGRGQRHHRQPDERQQQLDGIQGPIHILGSPVDELPAVQHALVNYTVSAGSGNPPTSATRPTVATTNVPIGNTVNITDTNRSVAGNNIYQINGGGFLRTGAALVSFVNDATGKYGIQTFTLHAGLQGNNHFQVQLPEKTAAMPLLSINIDGGSVNSNVLTVNGANSSNVKATGTIGGAPVTLNTIIAGDGTIDTPPGAVQPIQFSKITSLYLIGTPGRDLMVNNSSTFAVFNGNGGGDWMMSGFGQDVLYGGGAPAGTSVFMFGRSFNPNPGFLLPNNSLTSSDSVSFAGTAFLDGNSSAYSAVASNASIHGVTGKVFTGNGSLDVISWLRAASCARATRFWPPLGR